MPEKSGTKFSSTKYTRAHFEIKWFRENAESLQKHHQIAIRNPKHLFLITFLSWNTLNANISVYCRHVIISSIAVTRTLLHTTAPACQEVCTESELLWYRLSCALEMSTNLREVFTVPRESSY